MAKAAQNPKLKAAFENHEGENRRPNLDRRETAGEGCAAIEGILDEGKEIMDEYQGAPALSSLRHKLSSTMRCAATYIRPVGHELGNSAGVIAFQKNACSREKLYPRPKELVLLLNR